MIYARNYMNSSYSQRAFSMTRILNSGSFDLDPSTRAIELSRNPYAFATLCDRQLRINTFNIFIE